MSSAAEEYYTRITEGIAGPDVRLWEEEMKSAEDARGNDKSVMDIIGSRKPPSTLHTPEDDSISSRNPEHA